MNFSFNLLAESGGSKTEWRLIDDSGVTRAYRGVGLNPATTSVEQIRLELQTVRAALLDGVGDEKPQNVWFYGAGLGTETERLKLENLIREAFDGAVTNACHDLLGAARACGAGVVCILGTGSNSCLFDGQNIISERGGHGYLLGDEGGGADLGKRLLKAGLEGRLTAEVSAALLDFAGDNDLRETRNRLYHAPQPHRFLAQFAPFYDLFPHRAELTSLLRQSFEDFFQHTVLSYPAEFQVHFVGSIAARFESLLRELCVANAHSAGRFIQNPIDTLIDFHTQNDTII